MFHPAWLTTTRNTPRILRHKLLEAFIRRLGQGPSSIAARVIDLSTCHKFHSMPIVSSQIRAETIILHLRLTGSKWLGIGQDLHVPRKLLPSNR